MQGGTALKGKAGRFPYAKGGVGADKRALELASAGFSRLFQHMKRRAIACARNKGKERVYYD